MIWIRRLLSECIVFTLVFNLPWMRQGRLVIRVRFDGHFYVMALRVKKEGSPMSNRRYAL